MKKIIYLSAATALSLFAVACSNDDIPEVSPDGMTTFSVHMPTSVDSRAFSDGKTASQLFVAVYSTGENPELLFSNFGEGKNSSSLKISQFSYADDKPTATVSVPLVKNATYDVVFWAQSYANDDEDSPYSFDDASRSITVKYDKMSINSDASDAFYGKTTVKSSGASHDVTLKRPFAQLNIGTNDLDAAKLGGMEVSKAGIVVSGVANNVNLWSDAVSSVNNFSGEVSYDLTALPSKETFPVAGTPAYQYLAMGYFLVGTTTSDKSVINSVKLNVNNQTTDPFAQYPNIPMQGNYRTNIYGQLLTNSEVFNVNIEPAFAKPDISPMWDGNVNIALNGNTVLLVSERLSKGLKVSGTGTIQLSNCYIAPQNDGYSPAIELAPGANVKIVLSGDNTLIGPRNGDAIRVPETATLTLTGDNLTAIGNNGLEYEVNNGNKSYCNTDDDTYTATAGSAIGNTDDDSGKNDEAYNTGTIIIDNVKSLTAKGYGRRAFGIGGHNANIIIKNSVITEARGGFAQPKLIFDTKYGKSEPEGGAAIGVSGSTGTISISDSQILSAHGGSKAAAIGASYWSSASINITNSRLTDIVGGNASAGIGGSRYDSNGAYNLEINIDNSEINATGGEFGAGIGNGYDTHCKYHAPNTTKIVITGNSVIAAKGGANAAGIGTGFHSNALTGSIAGTVNVSAVQAGAFDKKKAGYTINQAIGYGIMDPTREAKDLDVTFTVNGVVIPRPEVQE